MGARTSNKHIVLHAAASQLIMSAGIAKARKQLRRAQGLFAEAARIEDHLSKHPTTKRRHVILVSAASCYVNAGDAPRALDCLGRLCKLRPVAKGQLHDIQSVARFIATIV